MAKSRGSQRRRAASAQAAARAKAKPAPAPAAAPSPAPARKSGNGNQRKAPPSRLGQNRPAKHPGDYSPLGTATAALGIPPLGIVLGGSSWLLVALLGVTGTIGGGFALFLGALLSGAVAAGYLVARVSQGKGLFGPAAGVVVVLAAAMPVLFDPHTGDVFNLPRYTLLVIGGLVLAGLWLIAAVHERTPGPWRTGLQWPIAAVVIWTAVAAFTGVSLHVGLLGNYGSYDGLYSALAFGALAMTAGGVLALADVRRVLAALAFAGGGAVVLYGLIQLHDTGLGGSRWDFINWHDTSFANQIFSTFGNPNHLAGYLAVILPVVLVLGLSTRRLLWRVLSGVFAVLILVEILRSAARGAWVAVLAAAIVLAIALAPELRRRPRLSLGGIGAVVVVAAVGMAAFGRRFLHVPLSSLFQSGGSTPVEQRFRLWHVAFDLAAHRPLTGVGPDSFAIVFQQHQSAAWVAGLGPNYIADGAHDVFMNVLADKGFVGLVLFVGLLLVAGLRAIGAWRRLRSVERRPEADALVVSHAQRDRLVLVAVSAGLTAYVVQAVFNVQQIGLSFTFWLLLGLLAVVTRSAGVPNSLRPRVLLAATPEPGDKALDEAEPLPASRRTGTRRRQALPAAWPTALVAVAATVVVVLLSLGADGPYRADHAFWSASTDGQATATATGAAAQALDNAYFADIKTAMSLNPWEPQYPANEAAVLLNGAARTTGSGVVTDLVQARSLEARAMADDPLDGVYAEAEATVDVDLARVDQTQKTADLAAAVKAARKALADNPLDTAYQQLLTAVQGDVKTGATNA